MFQFYLIFDIYLIFLIFLYFYSCIFTFFVSDELELELELELFSSFSFSSFSSFSSSTRKIEVTLSSGVIGFVINLPNADSSCFVFCSFTILDTVALS